MLDSIAIENSFAHKNANFAFQAGLTAITGRNGSGKSEILDMIRFAWFGSDALRTSVADYKGLRVTCEAKIRGVSYRVERTPTNAKLFREGDLLATGTRPVNLKVIDIFGYGLAVFDVANAARQKQIENLGAMRPADRKRLVDSTVGLNVLDDLAKGCGDAANSARRDADTLRSTLTTLTEPIKPEGYRPLAEIISERDELTKLLAERRDIERTVANPPPVPDEPQCSVTMSVAEMTNIEQQRRLLTNEIASLSNMIFHYPDPKLDLVELECYQKIWDEWDEQQKSIEWLKKHQKPKYTESQIDEMSDQLDQHDRWQQWNQLASKGGVVVCQKCNHPNFMRQKDMDALGDWLNKPEPPLPALTSLFAVAAERENIREFEPVAFEWELHNAASRKQLPKPEWEGFALEGQRAAHRASAEKAALIVKHAAHVAELKELPEITKEDRTARQAYERAIGAYRDAVERSERWEAQLPALTARLALLPQETALDPILTLLVDVQTFDRLHAAYLKDRERHDAIQARIAALETTAAEQTAAKAALTDLKARVKTFLVPSLSRVASV
ncbi:MAG TPA: AAA family ATPase, partial [Rhodopila sp.]|nr:AAA family ATPase [Rhodopila sp.]